MFISKSQAQELIEKLSTINVPEGLEWNIGVFVDILEHNISKPDDIFKVNKLSLERAKSLIEANKPKAEKIKEVKSAAKKSAKENSKRWSDVQKAAAKKLHQQRNRKIGDPRK